MPRTGLKKQNVVEFPIQHFSGYRFSSLESARFDINAYSRLKFGSKLSAKLLGRKLAEKFFASYRESLAENKFVVLPAAATAVPIASGLLAWQFFNRLNILTSDANLPSVEWSVIHRNVTYKTNYAGMDKEARIKLLSNDQQYFNQDYLDNKHLILIDDCRITGTHEDHMTEIMNSLSMKNPRVFCSYARYTGDDPKIESQLNHCFVKDVYDLVKLSHEPGHTVTTRVIRMLMEADPTDLRQCLRGATNGFIEQACSAAIINGYNVLPESVENFNIVRDQAKLISG